MAITTPSRRASSRLAKDGRIAAPGGDRPRLARAIVRRIDECGNLDCARRGNRAEAMPAE
jgi:hypothetical protein